MTHATDRTNRDHQLLGLFGRPSSTDAASTLLVRMSEVTQRLHAQRVADAYEARYREVFDHSLDGIARTAPDGTIYGMNDALLTTLGSTGAEAAARKRRRQGVLDATDARLPAALDERRRTGRVRAAVRATPWRTCGT